MVDRIAGSPGTLRVDALAADVGGSVRSLQRMFAERVGVGPKLVIRRYRLRDITGRMPAAARPRPARPAPLPPDAGPP